MKRADIRFRSELVAVICGYEIVALHSGGRVPTVSKLCWLHPILAWLLLGVGVHHFHPWKRRS